MGQLSAAEERNHMWWYFLNTRFLLVVMVMFVFRRAVPEFCFLKRNLFRPIRRFALHKHTCISNVIVLKQRFLLSAGGL